MTDLHHTFDEALLSGYLDKELTQGEMQRVRIHLEECAEGRRTLHEINRLRETTMTTKFNLPDDGQWSEAPRGITSLWFRRVGWILAVVWTIAAIGAYVWVIATESEDLFWTLFWVGLWLIPILVFLSVLIDRLKTRKTDRYRRVKK